MQDRGSPVPPELRRRLGLGLLTFYGLGNILGAGIYVLVGKVAGEAGYYAPLSFLLAALVASFTAFTYAELSARQPVAAGEVAYLQAGFGRRWLSASAGLLIVAAGLLPAATLARGFAGYARVFLDLPRPLLIAAALLALGAVAAWGIRESVRLAALFTLVEIAGLGIVIAVGGGDLPRFPARMEETASLARAVAWPGIFAGAFLAFYAFIGFEDMVNVAEETIDPARSMPRAIMLALGISTVLYGLVVLVAVSVLAPGELAASGAPLADVYRTATGREPVAITAISLFAVINGALIQLIMASRILYGMARRGSLPAWLGRVGRHTGTPLPATALVTAVTLALALWFPLVRLAEATSYVILTVFLLVNLALLRIRREPPPPGVRVYPAWVPVLGAATVLLLLLSRLL